MYKSVAEMAATAIFQLRKSQAAKWCDLQLHVEDPANSLRTKVLMPSLINAEEGNQFSWNFDISDPVAAVEDLCRKRAELLAARIESGKGVGSLPGGRLLCFYPRESLCDGAANESSNGFFDIWNAPPWDTWIWYLGNSGRRHALYSWVPGVFVEIAAAGVSVNPEHCICWA
jgi:hypothetical protein